MFRTIQRWLRRRKYQEGKTVSQFIAYDVRRDVLVVNTARIDEGIITARVCTTNLLYRARGFIKQPEFGPVEELRIDELWHWTGQTWGGLPDGTSIIEHMGEEDID